MKLSQPLTHTSSYTTNLLHLFTMLLLITTVTCQSVSFPSIVGGYQGSTELFSVVIDSANDIMIVAGNSNSTDLTGITGTVPVAFGIQATTGSFKWFSAYTGGASTYDSIVKCSINSRFSPINQVWCIFRKTDQKLQLAYVSQSNGALIEIYELGVTQAKDQFYNEVNLQIDQSDSSMYVTYKSAKTKRVTLMKVNSDYSGFDFIKEIGYGGSMGVATDLLLFSNSVIVAGLLQVSSSVQRGSVIKISKQNGSIEADFIAKYSDSKVNVYVQDICPVTSKYVAALLNLAPVSETTTTSSCNVIALISVSQSSLSRKNIAQMGCTDQYCALTGVDYGQLQGLIYVTHEAQVQNYRKVVLLALDNQSLALKVAYDVKVGAIEQSPFMIKEASIGTIGLDMYFVGRAQVVKDKLLPQTFGMISKFSCGFGGVRNQCSEYAADNLPITQNDASLGLYSFDETFASLNYYYANATNFPSISQIASNNFPKQKNLDTFFNPQKYPTCSQLITFYKANPQPPYQVLSSQTISISYINQTCSPVSNQTYRFPFDGVIFTEIDQGYPFVAVDTNKSSDFQVIDENTGHITNNNITVQIIISKDGLGGLIGTNNITVHIQNMPAVQNQTNHTDNNQNSTTGNNTGSNNNSTNNSSQTDPNPNNGTETNNSSSNSNNTNPNQNQTETPVDNSTLPYNQTETNNTQSNNQTSSQNQTTDDNPPPVNNTDNSDDDPPPIQPINTAPYFRFWDPRISQIIVNKANSTVISLPPVVDEQNDDYMIKLLVNETGTYNPSIFLITSETLTINPQTLQNGTIYSLTLLLQDKSQLNLNNTYNLTIKIFENPILVIEPPQNNTNNTQSNNGTNHNETSTGGKNETQNFNNSTKNDTIGPPLQASISYVSYTGQTMVQFSDSIYPISNAQALIEDRIILINLKRGSDYYELLSNFISTSDSAIQFQISLKEQDEYIGLLDEIIQIELTFMNTTYFKRLSDNATLSTKSVIKQISTLYNANEDQVHTATTISSAVSVLGSTTMVGSIALSATLGVGMAFLWSFLNVVQILAFLPLLSLKLPTFLLAFFSNINQFNLMVIDVTQPINNFLNLQPISTEPLNEDFDNIGLSSSNIFTNCPDFFTILLLFLALHMLSNIAVRVMRDTIFKDSIVYRSCTYLQAKLRYGLYLDWIIGNYLSLATASIVNLKVYNFQNFGEALSSITALLVFIGTIFFTIWSTVFLLHNRNKLDEKSVSTKYNQLYESFRYQKSTLALLYQPILMIRRLLFIALIFIFWNYPLVKLVMILTFVSFSFLIYVYVAKPFEQTTINKLEFFNQSFTFLTFVSAVPLSSGFNINPKIRIYSGHTLLSIFGVLALVNFIYAMVQNWQMIKSAYLWIKRKVKKLKKNSIHPVNSTDMGDPKHIEHLNSYSQDLNQLTNDPIGDGLVQSQTLLYTTMSQHYINSLAERRLLELILQRRLSQQNQQPNYDMEEQGGSSEQQLSITHSQLLSQISNQELAQLQDFTNSFLSNATPISDQVSNQSITQQEDMDSHRQILIHAKRRRMHRRQKSLQSFSSMTDLIPEDSPSNGVDQQKQNLRNILQYLDN